MKDVVKILAVIGAMFLVGTLVIRWEKQKPEAPRAKRADEGKWIVEEGVNSIVTGRYDTEEEASRAAAKTGGAVVELREGEVIKGNKRISKKPAKSLVSSLK